MGQALFLNIRKIFSFNCLKFFLSSFHFFLQKVLQKCSKSSQNGLEKLGSASECSKGSKMLNYALISVVYYIRNFLIRKTKLSISYDVNQEKKKSHKTKVSSLYITFLLPPEKYLATCWFFIFYSCSPVDTPMQVSQKKNSLVSIFLIENFTPILSFKLFIRHFNLLFFFFYLLLLKHNHRYVFIHIQLTNCLCAF